MRITLSPRARATSALATAALGLAVLTGCGSDDAPAPSTAGSEESSSTDTSSRAPESAALSVTDPYVKAAESGMTAAFGTLVNSSDAPITIVGASSDITTSMELHETVAADGTMKMRQKEGGFTIDPGGEHLLEPGGDHLMIMDLTRAVEPGESVIIKLTLDDGSTMEIDALVKEFDGADEEYMGDMGDSHDMDGEHSGDHGSSS
ncbi:copper chaperone PCu(A)C [Nocardioides sp. R-C-SC26]|uniref:copper chaperone PCu(A)C n=1 Tax=Nocardioides sp. R-C-SC26 TaxID=2870414 RepID=UPI001E4549CD|nr:copper chaperone PCu(A)C [Nocardioides sp. R-C-SC26]